MYLCSERWGAGMVICLERGADLHMAQLVPLPLTISFSSKIQVGFTFLVPAHPGSPRQRAVKRGCVCVCVFVLSHSFAEQPIVSNCVIVTVKPLMFVCPLFCKNNKTTKLMGANTDTMPSLISVDVQEVRLAHCYMTGLYRCKWV